ncbi:MAG: L-fucose:H+ symporter permease, partial [Bacteroidota bacterium]
MNSPNTSKKAILVEKSWLIPFILVTFLFFLWGFPNDLTNPMVEVFKNVLNISNVKASYVQLAFYGGYGTMAIPAALFIRKYRYKSGIILGLLLFMLGSFLMLPAAKMINYELFLISFYVLTFGLAFLETTANPMILAMGDPVTATQRLNLAQAFNPIEALSGQIVARVFVVNRLETKIGASTSSLETSQETILHDLNVVSTPYVILGFIVLGVLIIFFLTEIKIKNPTDITLDLKATIRALLKNKNYYEGVIAQFFYVACQIMVWTFIYQYITALNAELAIDQQLNPTVYVVTSTLCFLLARWICTFLIRYIPSAKLLLIFAILGSSFCLGAIVLGGMLGLYLLIGFLFYVIDVPNYLRHFTLP